MTGNILQAIADTQDEHGGYPGQLISYTDSEGNIHDGILMPDKWNSSMLKNGGAPLNSRLQQIKEYKSVTSRDGKVKIEGNKWGEMFYLTVPKTKKEGAVYFENEVILKASSGGVFYPYRGQLRADIPATRIVNVVNELTNLGVKVNEESKDDVLYRDSQLNPQQEISVIQASSKHGFESFSEAKEWAKEHIARTYTNEETGNKGEIRISNTAIDKFLSKSSVEKSDDKDVHLSVLKVLPDVVRESIDAEQHADYKKGKDGVRSPQNGINQDIIIHRLYGAVAINGDIHRVKITLKENIKTKEATKSYNYEATKIELLAGQHGDVSMTSPRNSNNSITLANLLKGVEKSYSNGELLLLDEDANLRAWKRRVSLTLSGDED